MYLITNKLVLPKCKLYLVTNRAVLKECKMYAGCKQTILDVVFFGLWKSVIFVNQYYIYLDCNYKTNKNLYYEIHWL